MCYKETDTKMKSIEFWIIMLYFSHGMMCMNNLYCGPITQHTIVQDWEFMCNLEPFKPSSSITYEYQNAPTVIESPNVQECYRKRLSVSSTERGTIRIASTGSQAVQYYMRHPLAHTYTYAKTLHPEHAVEVNMKDVNQVEIFIE
jgi:hypothetical protein